MMLHRKQLLKRALEVAVLVISALYIISVLRSGWGSVSSHLVNANWWLLLVAVIFFFAYFACRALSWGMIMNGLGHRLGVGTSARMWLISELGRYIPGNVWSFLGRVYLAEKKGIPRRVTATGLVVEIYLLVGSAGVFAALFLALLPYDQFAAFRWLLLGAPVLAIVLSPSFFNWALGRLASIGRLKIAKYKFKESQVLTILGMMTVGWGLYGFASFLVLCAFSAIGNLSWLWLVAMFGVCGGR